jgi:protein-S-isoprenylcysteine O-methyltransferase Ste14
VYLGWVLFVFGAPNMTADRLAFAVISSAYLVIAVPWEERSLRKSFGRAYEDYERTVRWRIIPYVY